MVLLCLAICLFEPFCVQSCKAPCTCVSLSVVDGSALFSDVPILPLLCRVQRQKPEEQSPSKWQKLLEAQEFPAEAVDGQYAEESILRYTEDRNGNFKLWLCPRNRKFFNVTLGTEKLMADEDIAEYQVKSVELRPVYDDEDELTAMALFVANAVTSFPVVVDDFKFLFLHFYILSSTTVVTWLF